MNKTPEALRLAEVAPYLEGGERGQWIVAAASELRRLHSLNQELLAALKAILAQRSGGGLITEPHWAVVRAAIAKAEGEQK